MVYKALGILLLALSLPGLLEISESDPPRIGQRGYILDQNLPGFDLNQVEEWFKPMEDRLLKAPEVASVELSVYPDRGTLQVQPHPGGEGAALDALLLQIEEMIREEVPERNPAARFSTRKREAVPWLLALYADPEKAESAKAMLETAIGKAGKVKLMIAPREMKKHHEPVPSAGTRAFPQLLNTGNGPYPLMEEIGSERKREEIVRNTFMVSRGENSTLQLLLQERNRSIDAGTFLDGKPASLLAIYPGDSGSLSIYHQCLAVLEPAGLIIHDGAKELMNELNRTIVALLLGAALVGILLILGKKRIDEYGAILLVLPLTLVPGLALVGYGGGSIHLLNLTALACCSGTLIDGAVLVVEELRYRISGALEASWMGTATTIASFFPLLFLPPPLGPVTRQFAIIPVIAMILSIIYSTGYLPLQLTKRTAQSGRLVETGTLCPISFQAPKGSPFLPLTMPFPLVSSILLLLPFILIPLSGNPVFSSYGLEKQSSIQGRIDFPEHLPHGIIGQTIPKLEAICKKYYPGLRSLIYQEGESITVQLFSPSGKLPGSDAEEYQPTNFHQELHTLSAPLGGSFHPAGSNATSMLQFHIMHKEQKERGDTVKVLAEYLEVIFPRSRPYSNEPGDLPILILDLRPEYLFSSGYFPHLVARELTWRLGGGGITTGKELYPADLNDLELMVGEFHPFLQIRRDMAEHFRFRRNGIATTTITLYLPGNRLGQNEREKLKNMERQLSRDFPGMIEWTPELKKMEEITIQAVQGAAASLLSILLLLIFLYNGVLKPLLILFPVLSGLAWSMVLLAWADIPLTLPGTGALFFSAGIGVNTGLLLLPRRERRGGEGLSLSALLVPILTTLGGIAPLLFLSTGASLDLPVIILVTTIVSTLGALGVSSLHGRFTPPQAVPPND